MTSTTSQNRAGSAQASRSEGAEGVYRAASPRPTVSARVALGKADRATAPRSAHAAFAPAANRTAPLEMLERQASTRVPELVPIRYGRMLASPFAFYRGAAIVMAHDLDSVGAYRAAMREFAGMGNLAVWYARLDIEGLLASKGSQFKPAKLKPTARLLAKARSRDSMSALSKLTHVIDAQARIVDQSPLIVPIDVLVPNEQHGELLNGLTELVHTYRHSLEPDRQLLLDRFQLADFARKVVGVGSVGTRAWIALFVDRGGKDPLFLQIKEAEASVLEEHLGASSFANHGRRVVTGQRLMQSSSDIFLGWLHVASDQDGRQRDYYGRQLKDWKGSAEIDQMTPPGMAIYGKLCGWTLARAHARSGDGIAIASYLGGSDKFDRAILEFSTAYAEQNELDYQAFVTAAKSGRIRPQTGL